jgi:hypothetical protein
MATDPLFGTTAVSVTTTAVSTSSTATMAGECVVVTVGNIAASAQFAANASVRVRNTTSGITTGWQSCGLLFVGQIAAQYHDIPVANGDTVVVDIIAPATITAAKTTIAAVLTTTAMHPRLRSDGRGMPLLSQVVGATGAVTLVSAPVTGFRVLVGYVTVAGLSSTTGTPNVSITLNGSAGTVIAIQGSGAIASSDSWEVEGLLCDPATAVVGSLGGGATGLYQVVMYDIVPL